MFLRASSCLIYYFGKEMVRNLKISFLITVIFVENKNKCTKLPAFQTHSHQRDFLMLTLYMLAPVSALSQFLHCIFCPVLALGRFVPPLAPRRNGDPVLALGAPFKNWVPNPNTIPNPKWSWHGGATMWTNSPSAGTGTLQHISAGTGTVPGWAPAYISLC